MEKNKRITLGLMDIVNLSMGGETEKAVLTPQAALAVGASNLLEVPSVKQTIKNKKFSDRLEWSREIEKKEGGENHEKPD